MHIHRTKAFRAGISRRVRNLAHWLCLCSLVLDAALHQVGTLWRHERDRDTQTERVREREREIGREVYIDRQREKGGGGREL